MDSLFAFKVVFQSQSIFGEKKCGVEACNFSNSVVVKEQQL